LRGVGSDERENQEWSNPKSSWSSPTLQKAKSFRSTKVELSRGPQPEWPKNPHGGFKGVDGDFVHSSELVNRVLETRGVECENGGRSEQSCRYKKAIDNRQQKNDKPQTFKLSFV